jgi:hypothetical protein
VFFARPKFFADGLVVVELGRRPDEPAVGAADADMHDAFARAATAGVENRLGQAAAVVAGRVSAVRRSILATSVPSMLPTISEHDPDWHEAVVDVQSVLSGSMQPAPVTVLFPASIDIAWHRAPKYAPGQEGVFVLHSEQVPAAAAGITGPTYTTLHPQDFQAKELEPQIRALIERSHR